MACLTSLLQTYAQSVNITYRYTHNGNIWYTETKTVTVGDSYPEVIAQPEGVNYLTMPVGTVSAAETVDIECEYTGEFFTPYVSDTYSDARWLFLSLNGNSLQYVSGQSYISLNSRSSSANSYQWALVGNPLSGYKVVNRAAGSAMVLASPAVDTSNNTGGNPFPTMMTESSLNLNTYNKYWDIHLDGNGNLVALSNMNSFSVPSAVATALANGTYKISIPYVGLNVQAQSSGETPFPATTATGVDFQFVPVAPGYVAIINADSYAGSSYAGALHEQYDLNVVNWNTNDQASLWTIEDAEFYGDADGDGVVDDNDIPNLVDMLVGNETKSSVGDVNKDGEVTLADLTALKYDSWKGKLINN